MESMSTPEPVPRLSLKILPGGSIELDVVLAARAAKGRGLKVLRRHAKLIVGLHREE